MYRSPRAVPRFVLSALVLLAVSVTAGCGIWPGDGGGSDSALGTTALPGIFTGAQPDAIPLRGHLGAMPSSPYEWDGRSVMLVDLERGESRVLGEGLIHALAFGPQSRYVAWQPGELPPEGGVTGRVQVVDLASGELRDFEDAAFAGWSPEGDLSFDALGPDGERRVRRVIDLDSGASEELEFSDEAAPPVSLPGFTVWRRHAWSPNALISTYYIAPEGSADVFTVDAQVVFPIDASGTLAIFTPPTRQETFNVFRLVPGEQEAEFVASLRAPQGIANTFGVVGERLVLADGACEAGGGRLIVVDADGGERWGIGGALPVATAPETERLGVDGRFMFSRALLDLETLEYGRSMPAPAAWSPDGRWALVGPYAGDTFEPCEGMARAATP